METLLQVIVSGVSTGSIYALMALGMTVIYRSTTVLNFAHGESLMLGGFFAYVSLVQFRLPYPVAIVVSLAGIVVVGYLTDKVAFQPLLNAGHLQQVLATVALLFIFRGVVRFISVDERALPPLLGNTRWTISGVALDPQRIIIAIVVVTTSLGFAYVFRRTDIGRVIRASTQNLRGCALVGIDLKRVFSGMWMSGILLAGIAGILAAPLLLVRPDMGSRPLLLGFAGMTLGGFGSFPGAVVGAILVGLVESTANFYVSTSLGDVAGLALIFLILLVRPKGLFGTEDVA
jgi:branched-chain amino acid transport system permease protein